MYVMCNPSEIIMYIKETNNLLPKKNGLELDLK